MWMTTDRRRRDLARWRDAGWVTADGETAILAELDDGGGGFKLANVFGVIAAILLGCAVLTFVASNWQEMSRLERLLLLGGSLLTAYAAAGVLFERGMPGLAQAAVLLGVLIYGASIMLISQMYHIDGHPPDGVLLWAIGALAAGYVLRSMPALFAALALFALWSGWESSLTISWGTNGSVHWPFPVAVAAVAAGFARERSQRGLNACAVALTAWVLSIGLLMPGGRTIVPMVGAIAVLAAIAIEHASRSTTDPSGSEHAATNMSASATVSATPLERITSDTIAWLHGSVPGFARSLLFYGAAVLFGGVVMNMLTPVLGFGHREKSWATLIIWYGAGLVLSIAGVWYGTMTTDRALTRLGYAAFAVTVLIIFFRTVGSLMLTSAFFFIAGLLAVGLAVAGWQLSSIRPPVIPPSKPLGGAS
ncbi:MAG: DUF2157 domain-containing protein [Hyphomicrobium aestuarii]|nr:DUF2157 domain-containing protein [Hyphomicrobium aestuarii]